MEKVSKSVEKTIDRMKSGITGFDEILKGGVPQDNVVLLTGTPGSGKTTFAMQFLMNGAKNGEKGVFFTLEERSVDIIKQFEVFDKDVKSVVARGDLKIVETPVVDYATFKETLTNEIEANNAKRVAIDSITYLQMFFADPLSIRRAIIEIATLLKAKKSVGLLIGETPYGENKLSMFGVEEFATDGVVSLHFLEKENTFIRALRVVKMRGTDHLIKYCPMEITKQGIIVHPNAELFMELDQPKL